MNILVEAGESIASEGKGEYMYVEGRVTSTDGKPIPDAVIETWETDEHGEPIFSLLPRVSNIIKAYTILSTANVPPLVRTVEAVCAPTPMAGSVIVQ